VFATTDLVRRLRIAEELDEAFLFARSIDIETYDRDARETAAMN
jgi:hypothetical protein